MQGWANRGTQRFSFGITTDIGCLAAVDSTAVVNTLQELWECTSDAFTVLLTGGDCSLPGADMQEMHSDIKRVTCERLQANSSLQDVDLYEHHYPGKLPSVKAYFPLVELDEATGPPRFVGQSHHWFTQGYEAQEWEYKLAYCPKGSAILMDQRVWHRGTSNRSQNARPMLSVHYAAPFFQEEAFEALGRKRKHGHVNTQGPPWHRYNRGSLTEEQWCMLPPIAQKLCQHLLPDDVVWIS